MRHWGRHCAARPRLTFQLGRGGRHRPDSACYPCRHPPSSSATAVFVTLILTQLNENGKTGLSATLKNTAFGQELSDFIAASAVPRACACVEAARGEKCLFSGQIRAMFTPDSSSLAECRCKSQLQNLSIVRQSRNIF